VTSPRRTWHVRRVAPSDAHASERHDPTCALCQSLHGPDKRAPLWEDEHWHVREIDAPYPVPGWLILVPRAHVAGPAHMSDAEAASFGLVLRHFERALERVTGALRIYRAALGEAAKHMHVQMVPRYAEIPFDAKGWALFDLQRRAQLGEVVVPPEAMRRVLDDLRAELERDPPPR